VVDLECCSVNSDCECPVCYQLFCEPIKAGCERHIFCRNCLLKSQGLSRVLRCPICRVESSIGVTEIPEVTEVVDRLKRRDAQYELRVATAQREREEHRRHLQRWAEELELRRLRLSDEAVRAVGNPRTWLPAALGTPPREVSGAGCGEVNGVYVAGMLPTYVGPTVYWKPNTHLYMFRWHQTMWVIAELSGRYSMGNTREWLYQAPTQYPPDTPPLNGWQVGSQGRGSNPAPEVRIVDRDSAGLVVVLPRRSSFTPAVRSNRSTWSSSSHFGLDAADHDMQVQASCRCDTSCSVM
jgi:hypothetical protein